MGMFESGAILVYLAEKTGMLMPSTAAGRYETLQWVFFQMANIGPMFGQLGYFYKWAGREIEDKRPLERYRVETKRLLEVLDGRLAGREWVMGDTYTIADISMVGWVRSLINFYKAGGIVEYDRLKHVPAWLARCLARPAAQRGVTVPAAP
jgi:GST-like protein